MQVSVTVRIMTLIAAFLICLAVKLSCAAKLQCPNAVSCICGNKEEYVTFCIPEGTVETEVCARLSNCESCQEGLHICSKCPEGFGGSFCMRRLNKFRQKRQFSLSDRDYVRQTPGRPGARSCPFLDSSDMESIECVQTNSEKQTCTGKCWEGFHFMVLDYRTEITLRCRGGVWRPLDSFPKCIRYAVEEVIFCADPGINANSFRQPSQPPDSRGFRQGSRLVYNCDRGYDLQGERNIFCLMSGEWSEDRPRCVPQSTTPGTAEIDLIFCPDPGLNANSFRKQTTQPSSRGYLQGSQIEYICDQGYVLSGVRSVVCLATGKWTANIPTCVIESLSQGPRNPTPSTSNAPDLCEDATIDTITQTESGDTYVFKGDFYWKVLPSGKIAKGYPRKISDDWDGLEGNLDASVTLPTGKTYFFKGRHYWRFNDKKMDSDFPKLISAGFKGIPDNLDAGVVWSGNGKPYFFKGKKYLFVTWQNLITEKSYKLKYFYSEASRIQANISGNKYWQYDDNKDPPVGTIYPQPITEWSRFLAGGINAALQWENNRTYFFKGDEYYRYNDTASEVDSDPPYPLSTATEWFGCR